MGDEEDEFVHLDAGGLTEENEEIYPRAHFSTNKKHREMDPADRYAKGVPAKDMARYSTSLRSMLPVRISKKSSKGGAKIDDAGLFSFVTYAWVFEYLYSAFKGRLDKDQIWSCSIYDATNVNMARMEILWEEHLKQNPKSPSLFKVLFAFIKTRLWTSCAVFFFCLIFGFIGPTCFIRGLISFAETPVNNANGTIDYAWGLTLVASICIVEFARVLAYGATWAVSYRTGIRVRGAMVGLLFKRLVSCKNLGKLTPAEVVNMIGNDGQRLFDAVTFAPLVLVGPLVLIGGTTYLIIVIGPWSLLGIAVFFIFDVIQYMLGKTMMRSRAMAIKKTEDRISLMGEIIRCIRIIKANAWEEHFGRKIEQLRRSEKIEIRMSGYAQSLAIACGSIVPVVSAILTFLGVVLSGNDLLASDAFSAITVFFVMLFGIRMIPYGSRYLAEAIVALRRIQAILLMDQLETPLTSSGHSPNAIRFKNASFMWSSKPEEKEAKTDGEEELVQEEEEAAEHPALNSIDIAIENKQLIGICGAVGSGKTALLNAILGRLHQTEGELEVNGTTAFVPQAPWIQNATVRENILFGQQMHTQRYYSSVSSSQLTVDFEAMTAGDETEIGERGTTLSGGQKARVSLARALYSHRDIYLLDDVFASLDGKVADKIFEQAILGVLKKKTVLMVSSVPSRLARCDKVLFVDNARVVAFDTHEKLLTDCDTYRTFCESAVASQEFTTAHSDNGSSIDSTFDNVGEVIDKTASNKDLTAVNKEKDKLVDDEEDLGLAKMSFSVYKKYCAAAGGWFVWVVLLTAFVINVLATIFSTFWLSRWLKTGHGEHMVEENGTSRLYSDGSLASSDDTAFFASIYGVSLVVLFLSGLFKAVIVVKVTLNAGSRLHNGMFNSLIRASVAFFDATPTGRILNRFSKDMDEIDVKLPFTAEVFLQNMITCVFYLMMIAWVFPQFLVACIPLLIIFFVFVACFRAGIRSLKRSENISRSPLFDHVTASLEGLAVVNSFGQSTRFIDEMKRRLDNNSGSMFMFQSAMRWLAVWLDLLVVMITSLVALLIVMLTGKVSPADAGMAIAFAVQMSGIFQFAVRNQTELEAKMTSVERVAHYSQNIESEGEWETRKGVEVPKDWPQSGQINFDSIRLRYRPHLPLALDDLTFEINAGEKIGVIGRTGSGKSSIGNILYRLYPPTFGRVFVDGVDTATVGLHRLRRVICVIPQDPVLFAGTIRSNLDPLALFADSELWNALEKTYLKNRISQMPNKLESAVNSGGDNLSLGERQLLCLTRAILTKSKIVLLDEATASIDQHTDKLIQKVMEEAFSTCTVITIAHRLENVHKCDRIMLLDGGKLLEFDVPEALLSRTTAAGGVSGMRRSDDESQIVVSGDDIVDVESLSEDTPQEVDSHSQKSDEFVDATESPHEENN